MGIVEDARSTLSHNLYVMIYLFIKILNLLLTK